MNILSKVTWKAMWKNKVRTLVTIAGIILSAAMFSAVTTLGVSILQYLMDATAWQNGNYFIRFDYVTEEHINELRKDETVNQIGDLQILGYTDFRVPVSEEYTSAVNYILAGGDDLFFDMASIHLEEGRLPENSGEIVISRNSYHYLQEAGRPCNLGDTLTLDVKTNYEPLDGENQVDIPQGDQAFTKSYTIVGIGKDFNYLDDHNLFRGHLFTYADGTDAPIWHRVYCKTRPAKEVYTLLARHSDTECSLNGELLALYGASKYTNYNSFLYAICAVLIGIIMVGSVSLIYNAFSISVSERTKQFGLLSSIGATKRQLRRSVYFEALALSAMGIPLGLLFGYGGIAVTLYFLRNMLQGILYGITDGSVMLRAVPSLPAFVCAALVTILTTLLSASLPARRATKVEPIAAIRQIQDYKIPKRLPRKKRSVFGFAGIMAQKYYRVSKGKYRSTALSLAITIVLFLAASGFSNTLQMTAQDAANETNFDIICYRMTKEQIEEIRALPGVSKSMLQYQQSWMTFIPDEDCTEDFLNIWKETQRENPSHKYLGLVYMEDAAFEEYLREHDLDESKYQSSPIPTALVSSVHIVHTVPSDTGRFVSQLYEAEILKDSVETLPVFPDQCPNEVWDYVDSRLEDSYVVEPAARNGLPVWIFRPILHHDAQGNLLPESRDGTDEESIFVAVVPADGKKPAVSYHLYDPFTDTLTEEPIVTVPMEDAPSFRLGDSIQEMPFGTNVNMSLGGTQMILWLPLSSAGEIPVEDLELVLNTSSHQAVLNYLKEHGILHSDFRDTEIYQRNLKTMVDVFSYGFIILITLICVCNVFNTISTNVALRRRDFGMLRSVGMENMRLKQMTVLECLRYGITATVFGLPLGIAANYGIYTLTISLTNRPYEIPLNSITLVIGCIFLTVFVSSMYALSKIKRDDPMKAIRSENI